jgi:hypothetical protein
MPILGNGLFSKTADGAPPVAPSHSLPGLLCFRPLLSSSNAHRKFRLRSARTFSASLEMKTRGFEIFRRTRAYRRKQSRCLWAFYKSEAMPLSRPKPSRFKHFFLAPKGRRARDRYHALIGTIEENWRSRFGEDAISALRSALERLEGNGPESPLFCGLNPPPSGWRASLPKPAALPDYPMVLHRGGYPDGS